MHIPAWKIDTNCAKCDEGNKQEADTEMGWRAGALQIRWGKASFWYSEQIACATDKGKTGISEGLKGGNWYTKMCWVRKKNGPT